MTLNISEATSDNVVPDTRIVIGIATAGRPGVLKETVQRLVTQSRQPDAVYVSVWDKAHLGDLQSLDMPFDIQLVESTQGTCHQRNSILKRMQPNDLILFIDDDFILAPDYLQRLQTLFAENPDIVQITGNVVADGILGPGYDHATAEKLLADALQSPVETSLSPIDNAYGCNMAMRMKPLLKEKVLFDEHLPHYGWLEDVDFSMSIKHLGRVVHANELRGVHLGTKRGRSPGKRLGYSQVANPIYLLRKGTLSRKRAFRIMGRNFSANVVRTFKPQPWVDHRGRLVGNFVGLLDVIRGRLDPNRAV